MSKNLSNTTIAIQASSVLVAPTTQKQIKTQLLEALDKFNQLDENDNLVINYILNNNDADLATLLAANPDIDVVFSGFNLHASSRYKSIADAKGASRFPVYKEWLDIVSKESFVAKQLILTGNIPEMLEHFLKNKINIVFYYKKEPNKPILVRDLSELYIQLTEETEPIYLHSAAKPVDVQPIILSHVGVIQIDQLTFHGILHIEKDGTIPHSLISIFIHKVLLFENERNQLIIQSQKKENRYLIRTKRFFICLDDPFKDILTATLSFLNVKFIEAYSSLEEAEHTLQQGSVMLLLHALKDQQYEPVFTELEQADRDDFFFHMLTKKEILSIFKAEYKLAGNALIQIEESTFKSIIDLMPDAISHFLINHIAAEDQERFLLQISFAARVQYFIKHIKNATIAEEMWDLFTPEVQTKTVQTISVEIASFLLLFNEDLFKELFPQYAADIEQEEEKVSFTKMSEEERRNKYVKITEEFKKNLFDFAAVEADVLKEIMIGYLQFDAHQFVDALTPEIRKEIWLKRASQHIDRVVALLETKERLSIILLHKQIFFNLFKHIENFLEDHLEKEEFQRFAYQLFITLKQFNTNETKVQFFKAKAKQEASSPHMSKSLLAFLKDPSSKEMANKLYAKISGHNLNYFLLITFSRYLPKLQQYPVLKNVTPVVIDQLISPDIITTLNPPILDPAAQQYDIETSLTQHIEKLEAQLAAEKETKVIARYLLESNIVCMKATLSIVQGSFSQETMSNLDNREESRKKLLMPLLQRLTKLTQTVKNIQDQIIKLFERKQKIMDAFSSVFEAYHEYIGKLKNHIIKKENIAKQLEIIKATKGELQGKTQQIEEAISKQIMPVLTEQIKSSFVDKVIQQAQSLSLLKEKVVTRRIFQLKERELQRIKKLNPVFVCSDPWVKMLLTSFLKTEKVDDVFSIVTIRNTITDTNKLVFIDAHVDKEKITEQAKHDQIRYFCDKDVFQQLQNLGKQEAQILNNYKKTLKKYQEYENFIAKANSKVAPLLQKQVTGHRAVNEIMQKYTVLVAQFKKKKYQLKRSQNTVRSLEGSLKKIDTSFVQIRKELTEVATQLTQNASDASVADELKDSLSSKFLSLSKEIGDVSFFQVVNDANKLIVDAIIEKGVEVLYTDSLFSGDIQSIKNGMIIFEEAVLTRNIKSAVTKGIENFFEHKITLQEANFYKLKARSSAYKIDIDLAVVLADRQTDKLDGLTQVVSDFKEANPDAYVITLLPYSLQDEQDIIRQTEIRNRSYLVNTSLAHLTSTQNMQDLLETIFFGQVKYQTKAEETKTEETKTEETKTEETKAEDTKAEDTKAEDTKAEDTKEE